MCCMTGAVVAVKKLHIRTLDNDQKIEFIRVLNIIISSHLNFNTTATTTATVSTTTTTTDSLYRKRG